MGDLGFPSARTLWCALNVVDALWPAQEHSSDCQNFLISVLSLWSKSIRKTLGLADGCLAGTIPHFQSFWLIRFGRKSRSELSTTPGDFGMQGIAVPTHAGRLIWIFGLSVDFGWKIKSWDIKRRSKAWLIRKRIVNLCHDQKTVGNGPDNVLLGRAPMFSSHQKQNLSPDPHDIIIASSGLLNRENRWAKCYKPYQPDDFEEGWQELG